MIEILLWLVTQIYEDLVKGIVKILLQNLFYTNLMTLGLIILGLIMIRIFV